MGYLPPLQRNCTLAAEATAQFPPSLQRRRSKKEESVKRREIMMEDEWRGKRDPHSPSSPISPRATKALFVVSSRVVVRMSLRAFSFLPFLGGGRKWASSLPLYCRRRTMLSVSFPPGGHLASPPPCQEEIGIKALPPILPKKGKRKKPAALLFFHSTQPFYSPRYDIHHWGKRGLDIFALEKTFLSKALPRLPRPDSLSFSRYVFFFLFSPLLSAKSVSPSLHGRSDPLVLFFSLLLFLGDTTAEEKNLSISRLQRRNEEKKKMNYCTYSLIFSGKNVV